jgi:DNA-binding transcriptional ArsR family regulator
MENERLDPVERLHAMLVGGASPPPAAAELETAYNLVEEEALDLVYGGERGKLDPFWQRLRRIYETLAARSPDDHETSVLYHLGRVAELTELLGVAAEHTHPSEVVDLLGQGGRELLVALRDAPSDRRTSTALGDKLGWEKSVLSRRLKRLGEFGLVLSRRSGQYVVSQLTPLGEQALRDLGAPPPPARRTASDWRPEHLEKKVAIP